MTPTRRTKQPRSLSALAQQFRGQLLPTLRWPRSLVTSESFADFQIAYESATDALAGPMYNYYERGNVEYVFSGRHGAFQCLKTRSALISWCREIIGGLRQELNAVEILDEVAKREQQVLLNRIREIEKLINLFDQCLREQYP